MPAHAVERDCVVPGCSRTGRNQIGLRCRVAHSGASPFPEKRRTDAIFSVESEAFLCDFHALAGGLFELRFTPSRTQTATIVASCGPETLDERTKEIRQPVSDAA
jgi:hypothetical protein